MILLKVGVVTLLGRIVASDMISRNIGENMVMRRGQWRRRRAESCEGVGNIVMRRGRPFLVSREAKMVAHVRDH